VLEVQLQPQRWSCPEVQGDHADDESAAWWPLRSACRSGCCSSGSASSGSASCGSSQAEHQGDDGGYGARHGPWDGRSARSACRSSRWWLPGTASSGTSAPASARGAGTVRSSRWSRSGEPVRWNDGRARGHECRRLRCSAGRPSSGWRLRSSRWWSSARRWLRSSWWRTSARRLRRTSRWRAPARWVRRSSARWRWLRSSWWWTSARWLRWTSRWTSSRWFRRSAARLRASSGRDGSRARFRRDGAGGRWWRWHGGPEG
jgi:hypothetical protein